MSVISAIKQFLPGSSRSLHAMHRDVADMHDEVHVEIAEIKRQIGELYRRIEQADNGINMNLNYKFGLLDSSLEAHDAHMKMFAWENYRKENESMDDAKKRFYRSLPKATGGMRLLQLGCAKLMGEFDALCRENGLQYWAVYGTLLGAIRHGGFIPWDDDTDIGMMRSDIDRLIEIVNDDDRYRITVVYDHYVTCKQIRFLYADADIPCFLDLFVYDWATTSSREKAEELRSLRAELADETTRDESLAFWSSNPYCMEGTDGADRIQVHFDKCYQGSRGCGVVCDEKDAGGIVWAIDNLSCARSPWYAYSLEQTFPLKRMMFEGVEINVPADADAYLKSCYDNYLDLPKDMCAHFEHVSHEELESERETRAFKRLLGE